MSPIFHDNNCLFQLSLPFFLFNLHTAGSSSEGVYAFLRLKLFLGFWVVEIEDPTCTRKEETLKSSTGRKWSERERENGGCFHFSIIVLGLV